MEEHDRDDGSLSLKEVGLDLLRVARDVSVLMSCWMIGRSAGALWGILACIGIWMALAQLSIDRAGVDAASLADSSSARAKVEQADNELLSWTASGALLLQMAVDFIFG